MLHIQKGKVDQPQPRDSKVRVQTLVLPETAAQVLERGHADHCWHPGCQRLCLYGEYSSFSLPSYFANATMWGRIRPDTSDWHRHIYLRRHDTAFFLKLEIILRSLLVLLVTDSCHRGHINQKKHWMATGHVFFKITRCWRSNRVGDTKIRTKSPAAWWIEKQQNGKLISENSQEKFF